MLHCLHHTKSNGTRQRARKVLTIFFHFSTDALRTRSFEMPEKTTEITKSENLMSTWGRPVTRFSMEHTISILVRRTSVCRRRSVHDPHFFLKTFFCVLRGAQRTLTGVQPLVPRYWPGYQWYHGIGTTLGQHSTAECRARLLCLFFSKSTGTCFRLELLLLL